MHISMYTFRFVYGQRYMSLYMYVCVHMSVHIYACLHACIPSFYSQFTIHIFDRSLNNYGSHIANVIHTAIMLQRHIDSTFLHMSPNTTNCNIYFIGNCNVGASNRYAPQKQHLQISSFAHMAQLCQYKYLIWTQCNKWYDQEHCYTYISYHWHIPETNMSVLLSINVPLQNHCSL